MATIIPFLQDLAPSLQDDAFGPDDIKAMPMALDDACRELKADGDGRVKEIIAIRIIELARCGERSPTRVRDRILQEASGGSGC
jgi:hypothetical protein